VAANKVYFSSENTKEAEVMMQNMYTSGTALRS